jgi:hypothetical protein
MVHYRQLTNKKRETIQGARFFTVSADEVTTIDNGSWVSMTIYYVDEFARESVNAALQHIDEGATSNNLTKIIMKAVQGLIGMTHEEIAVKMLAFGAGKWAKTHASLCYLRCIESLMLISNED